MRRPKGTGTIEKTKDGQYRARFPFRPGEREDVGKYATYEDAARQLDAILAELHEAGTVRGTTVRRMGQRVLDLRERDGYRSVDSERDRWRVYVESWDLIDAPALTVTRADVRHWLAGLGHLAAQTRRNALNLLRAVFAYGVDSGELEANPCDGVRVRDGGSTRETSTWLTEEESRRLLRAATDPAVALAIGTGMRQGELRSLLWEDVHESHIVVRFGAPKKPTKRGLIRHVPILPLAREALDVLPRRHPMVLPSDRGCFRQKGHIVWAEDWAAWLKTAEITRRVRWHDLRHTCATLLLTGAPLLTPRPWSYEEVKEMLGHSSVQVTERYARAIGLARKAALVSPKQARRVAAKCLSHLRDLNSRPTVYEAGGQPNDRGWLDRLRGLVWAYLGAVERGDPFAHRHGLDLASAVLELADDDVFAPLRDRVPGAL